jgi:hypothetical protein
MEEKRRLAEKRERELRLAAEEKQLAAEKQAAAENRERITAEVSAAKLRRRARQLLYAMAVMLFTLMFSYNLYQSAHQIPGRSELAPPLN